MSDEFKIEIVNPEKSFLSKEDVNEVVVPAFEGEMGILKDHISIISFLKPGIITIQAKSGEEKYYVEDGIIEFKNNTLSILTSYILNLKDIEKNKLLELLKNAEEELLATRERLRLGFVGVRTRDIITAQDGLLAAQQALSRAMVDYHKTRLKLLKDVGLLDTTQETFWLKTDPASTVLIGGNTFGASEDVVPPNIILGE